MKINFLLLSIAFVFASFSGVSQNTSAMETINASGNDATGDTGSVSYSIGQVFFTQTQSSVFNVAAGVQQSHASASNTDDVESPNPLVPEGEIIVYPNPTTDYVTIAMNGVAFEDGKNTYQLFNYQGKLLKQDTIEQNHTEINMDDLSSSMYLLQVFVNDKIWKTFKIMKN